MLANAKGILVAALSVALFHDSMPWRNCAGYAAVVAGAVAYSVTKARSSRRRTRARTRPLAVSGGSAAAPCGPSGEPVPSRVPTTCGHCTHPDHTCTCRSTSGSCDNVVVDVVVSGWQEAVRCESYVHAPLLPGHAYAGG